MRTKVGTAVAAALLSLSSANAATHTNAGNAGHSLEADQHDERVEGLQARSKASERVRWHDPAARHDPTISVKLLGINDFHGQLSPRTLGPPAALRPVGGAAVLASYLEAAADQADGPAFIIHAGDQVGASPPNSALLQDEPSISFLNTLANRWCIPFKLQRALPDFLEPYAQARCNVIGTLGNHEFDEGKAEVLRLLMGGNHPKGPFLEQHWQGARFPYVSANVLNQASGKTFLPPYTIKVVNGIQIGVIGAVLKDTPTIVTPSGVAGLQFVDEADAINASVARLKRLGVRTIVVTIHQGLRQAPTYEGPTDPGVHGLSGPIIDIVKRLSDEVDVVVSGHAHGFTNALVANNNGKQILLTQAFSASTAYDDIDLTISRRSGDVVEKSAAIVTTWGDQGPGLTPDTQVAKIVSAADERVAPLVNRLIGVAQTAITTQENDAGESAMGNLIADAQRASTGAQFAFMNPGGIRQSLDAGEVLWGELFAIQPFSNDLVSMDLTGAQIDLLLEQQWINQNPPKILKISGLTFTWDAARPLGDRVIEIRDAGGNLLDPNATYRVAVNSFLATGGDNFVVLNSGTNRVVGAVDLDALVEYVQALPQPFNARIEGRVKRIN
ncbi:MAG TPA: bifunctional metallophosphatase/5'-nucleotidase [Steroidobacteraceae bacterium]|jgi:5'-nucleotidase